MHEREVCFLNSEGARQSLVLADVSLLGRGHVIVALNSCFFSKLNCACCESLLVCMINLQKKFNGLYRRNYFGYRSLTYFISLP